MERKTERKRERRERENLRRRGEEWREERVKEAWDRLVTGRKRRRERAEVRLRRGKGD